METDPVAGTAALLLLFGLPLLTSGEETIRGALEGVDDRRPLYLSAALSLLVVALLTWGVAAWRGIEAAELGWRSGALGPGLAWGAGAAAAGLAALGVGTRLLRRLGLEETDVVLLLLPRSGAEKVAFLGLALLGALCEEYVFRGFLLRVAEVWAAPTGAAAAVATGVTSLSFGFAHGYQRASGVARATLLGLVLALPVLATGSLFPAVAAHFWINAVIGLGGWKWFLEDDET